MITHLISIFKIFLLNKGIIITKATSNIKLNMFFKRIQIFNTDKKLIRLGGNGDGGYLIPDDLSDVNFCFSPGVSNFAYFEEDLSKYGIKSFLADYSVNQAPTNNINFKFLKKFLGILNDEKNITLETWVNSNCSFDESDLILQMDIEGCEYDILIDANIELLKRFRIIIIEFHDLQNLFNPIGFSIINKCFDKLLDNFVIVHSHPNNTLGSVKYKNYEVIPVMEFTFLRKDRITNMTRNFNFPHLLDSDCVKNNTTIALPKCWYNF